MEGNRAGNYDVRADEGKGEQKQYFNVYHPNALMGIDDTDAFEVSGRMNLFIKKIYYQCGFLSGIAAREQKMRGKNMQVYKRELIACSAEKGLSMSAAEIYGKEPCRFLREKLPYFRLLDTEPRLMSSDIIGNIRVEERRVAFRRHQIFEMTRFHGVTLRGYTPPAADMISGLMSELSDYEGNKNHTETLIQSALICYQFLTIMPYEEDNLLWAGILVNTFLRERGLFAGYYVPLTRYFLERDTDRKARMNDVRQEGRFEVWVEFYLEILEEAMERTKRFVIATERIHEKSNHAVFEEKQRDLLMKIIEYMERIPIFDIKDIAGEFDIVYNTAAKMITILEKCGLVSEISKKQRYRLYQYDAYLKEIMK